MLSIPHMIIIFIVALVFFGPEKLPELARNLGKIMAEFRRATGDFKSTFEDHLRELEREADQRRINGAPVVTPSAALNASDTSAPPPEPGTVPTTPPHLSAASGPEPGHAPWDEAADTAYDAMNISPNPPEHAGEAPEPFISPEPQEKPHQHPEKSPEPAIHDDRPA